jgi:hypothetical protein
LLREVDDAHPAAAEPLEETELAEPLRELCGRGAFLIQEPDVPEDLEAPPDLRREGGMSAADFADRVFPLLRRETETVVEESVDLVLGDGAITPGVAGRREGATLGGHGSGGGKAARGS